MVFIGVLLLWFVVSIVCCCYLGFDVVFRVDYEVVEAIAGIYLFIFFCWQ
jgi:hypothetical protein